MAKKIQKHVTFSAREMAYDVPAELTPDRFIPILGGPVVASADAADVAGRVTFVAVDDAFVCFTFADGRKISAPVSWFKTIASAAPAERNDWKVVMGGRAVVWPKLKLGIAARALIEGQWAGQIKNGKKVSTVRTGIVTPKKRVG